MEQILLKLVLAQDLFALRVFKRVLVILSLVLLSSVLMQHMVSEVSLLLTEVAHHLVTSLRHLALGLTLLCLVACLLDTMREVEK